MKCGIITFHRAINYGGILQTFALQKALGNIGIDSEIIDYYCPYIERQYRPDFRDKISKRYIKKIIYTFVKNGTLKFNTKDFDEFTNRYLKLSERKYYSSAELKEAQYDKLITGSDQVWSYYCAGFDKSYFLEFSNDVSKKNSYAASFGVGQIPQELHGVYKTLLERFNHISVRESDGADIVEMLLGEKPQIVPDPTLLLTKEEWQSLLVKEKAEKDGYVLVYLLEQNDELIEKAKELAAQKNLKVIYINNRLYKKKGVTNKKNISPEEWVNLFYNADYVFTNSFHGIAFCINFNKNFYVEELKGNSKVNSRIEHILSRYGIENNEISLAFEENSLKMDVNKKIESDRKTGYEYLTMIAGD